MQLHKRDVVEAATTLLDNYGIADLTMRCSCPDAAVPCKHLAATFYLLADFNRYVPNFVALAQTMVTTENGVHGREEPGLDGVPPSQSNS